MSRKKKIAIPPRPYNYMLTGITTPEESDMEREITRLRQQVTTLRAALQAAADHLDYCGYGDRWESECARSEKLEERIEKALDSTDPNKSSKGAVNDRKQVT